MADTKISGAADATTVVGTDKVPLARVASTTAYYATMAEIGTYIGVTFAPLASPALTGNPTAPTASPGDADTSISTTAFVAAAVAVEITARNTAIGVETTRATTAEALLAPKASPTFTGTPTLPTGTIGVTQTALNSTTALATTAFATLADAVETTRATAAEGVNATAIATETTRRIAADAGQLSGLGLAFNTTTLLSIAAGTCTDSTATSVITLGAFTKSIAGSWVAGSGANGMGQGLTATVSTWYHAFAVIVSGAADVYFDSSVTAANKPASTTAFRRIGSFKLDASVHILPFAQNGDRFDWGTPVSEFSGTPGVTTAVTQTLAGAPTGVIVQVLLTVETSDPSISSWFYLSALAQADLAAGTTTAVTLATANTVNNFGAAQASITTNATAQIRRRMGTTTGTLTLLTNGWIDTRGRG